MMKKYRLCIMLILAMTMWATNAMAAVDLFGYSFDDSAFADKATLVDGKVDYYGFSKWGYPITGDDNIDLNTALTGPDLYTLIEGKLNNRNRNYPFTVDVAFTDNYLFNGQGADLTIWERGSPEPMRVAIFDPRINNWTEFNYYMPHWVGNLPRSVDISEGVNVASIDFSDWSIPESEHIDKVRLYWEGDMSSPDIATLGGLNSVKPGVVPEPASYLLFGIGCLMAILLRYRRDAFKRLISN